MHSSADTIYTEFLRHQKRLAYSTGWANKLAKFFGLFVQYYNFCLW